VDDFEDANGTNELGGGFAASADALSSINYSFNASGSTLPGGSPGSAMRIYGVKNGVADPDMNGWPYVEASLALGSSFNIDAKAPSGKIVFSYKAAAGSIGMRHEVRLRDSVTSQYDYYRAIFTPLDGNWTSLTIYLPGAGSGQNHDSTGPKCPGVSGNEFARPCWTNFATTQSDWSSIKINLVDLVIAPVGPTAATVNYDLSVDDIRFE
jgi:hypothetical protein